MGEKHLARTLSSRQGSPRSRHPSPEYIPSQARLPQQLTPRTASLVLARTKDATRDGHKDGGGYKDGDLFATDPWFKTVVPAYAPLPPSALPPGMSHGATFTSVCINTALYLPYLLGQCLAHGAHASRAILPHIAAAAALHHSGAPADLIINCTGLGAASLPGVMDAALVPVRGQVVVVRNDAGGTMFGTSGTDDADDELCYIMQRAAGGGTVLGGTATRGSWDGVPDMAVAQRIMKRAVELCPALTGGKGVEALSVVRHGVGLRPLREGGVRIEKERIGGGWVVHNYGHAGWGYQGSYGCAMRVVELVEEVLGPRAKL